MARVELRSARRRNERLSVTRFRSFSYASLGQVGRKQIPEGTGRSELGREVTTKIAGARHPGPRLNFTRTGFRIVNADLRYWVTAIKPPGSAVETQ